MAATNSSIPAAALTTTGIPSTALPFRSQRKPGAPLSDVTRGYAAANDALEARLAAQPDAATSRSRRRPGAPLVEVTRGFAATNDAFERAMGLAPTPDDKAANEAALQEQMHCAAADILVACDSVKKSVSEVKRGTLDPHLFAETTELFAAAVRSFAQAIQNQRKSGALANMREAIERLERTQNLRPPQ